MKDTDIKYPEEKAQRYRLLFSQMEALLEGEKDVIANLANASALLNEVLKDINWVGFYLMKRGALILGPFQGKVACVHIEVGKGVCGRAVLENKIKLVEDVHKFPGHIACDSASNSELVIPLRKNGKIVGVLDIDSPLYGRFDSTDAENLDRIAKVIEEACDWEID